MESTLFKSLVQVESGSQAPSQNADHSSSSLPQQPQRVVSRTYPAVPQAHELVELDTLNRGGGGGGRQDKSAGPSIPTTPREERDLEMSFPGTPDEPVDGFGALPSLTDPPMNRFRLATVCLQNFIGGLTDSAPGALIPYMESYYNIGYAVVSLIFIGNALGFIMAAPFVDQIRRRLGRGRALALSNLCMMIGYVPVVWPAPFPVVTVGYFFIGFGFAINLAIGNVFCANLQDGTTMLGAMHGSYGLGGTVGPLIATGIVSAGALWSRYYLLTLGFTVFNACFATWSFWNYEKEVGPEAAPLEATANATVSSSAASPGTEQMSAMLTAFKSKVVVLGAIFIFAYQGAEVSISGWVISFLIATRNGNPASVGYVTAGFWGGITLGRFVLSPLGARMGEKLFVALITVGAAVFQLLVWLVPNIIGEAVSLAVVGLLLGPVYPCAAAVFTRNLSRKEQMSGLSVISAFGSSGGAVAPFTTGILAQVSGTFVLHPIAIGLFGVMMLCWYGQPSVRKRSE
ncbi:major facilitator superfamily domain-containing protein [Xylariomycetidae sp. FL2044]|nr:major facilitator superfamily domain-containing protein [Xylariomycetidae sp. FL2044]